MHLSKPYWDGNYLIVNVVNPTAGVFAGDHVDLRVQVCRGASAVLTSPSATRVFRARSSTGSAVAEQSFHVESQGRLDVFPEILIAHTGARYAQRTRIEVQANGELFFTERIAPGRTASGESFDYDRLQFGTDLIVADKLAIRERNWMTSRSESIQAMRKAFPNAYYASAFIVSARLAEEDFQKAIKDLSTPSVLAGASRPMENVFAIKLIAADSLSLRQAVASLRAIAYSRLGWPEPVLRKL
jgi:urease accessory protein